MTNTSLRGAGIYRQSADAGALPGYRLGEFFHVWALGVSRQ